MVQKVSSQQNNAGESSYSIRRMQREDIPAIREVARISWDSTYANVIAPETRAGFITRSYSDNSLKYSLNRADKDNWFWVVEDSDEKIVGFAEIMLRHGARPDAELTRIYFLPEWQGRGVGSALLSEMLATLRKIEPESDLRPPRLWLTVEAENKQAIVFYERRGFRFYRDFSFTLTDKNELAVKEYVMDID